MRFANACLIALLWVCGRQYLSGETIAIKNVTVIDPREGTVQPNRTVVVEARRIQAVQAASAPVSKGARLVDGTRKFLIPGLWDAHVHLTKAGELSLPLFVVNGV